MERPFYAKASIALALLSPSSAPLAGQSGPPPLSPPSPEPTTSPAPLASASHEPAAAAPKKDAVTFDIAMRPDLGGGRATGSAGEFEYEEGRFLIASGGVELKYRDLRLVADKVRVDIPANKLIAEGKVILDEGPRRLSGTTLDYDLTTRTGRVTDAIASMDPDYYFRGAEIAKVGANTYTITDGVLTSCNQEVPSWSIALSSANVTLEEYARIRNARLRFKRLPVFYFPYIVWPATTERTSGFLIPKPGYSERRGANLSLAYYKTLGRSADATFYADLAAEGIPRPRHRAPLAAERNQPRAASRPISSPSPTTPSTPTELIFDPDRQPGDDRWKFLLTHESSKLWNDFRGVVSIQKYSDFDYLKDVERSVDRQTQSFIYSNAFLCPQRRPELVQHPGRRARADPRQQGPARSSASCPRWSIRCGRPSSARACSTSAWPSGLHYFSAELTDPPPPPGDSAATPSPPRFRYGRAYVNPALSIPLSTLPWLSVKVDLEGRATYWTDSLDPRRQQRLHRRQPDPGGAGRQRRDRRPQLLEDLRQPGRPLLEVQTRDRAALRLRLHRHLRRPEPDLGLRRGGYHPLHPFLVGRRLQPPARQAERREGRRRLHHRLAADRPGLQPRRPARPVGHRPRPASEGPCSPSCRSTPARTTSIKADVSYNTLFSQLQDLQFLGLDQALAHTVGATWYKTWNPVDGDQLERPDAVLPRSCRPAQQIQRRRRALLRRPAFRAAQPALRALLELAVLRLEHRAARGQLPRASPSATTASRSRSRTSEPSSTSTTPSDRRRCRARARPPRKRIL